MKPDAPPLVERHSAAILLSAQSRDDVSALCDTGIAFFEAAMVEDVLKLPYAKQGMIGEVYESARVLSEKYNESGRVLKVRGLDAIACGMCRKGRAIVGAERRVDEVAKEVGA